MLPWLMIILGNIRETLQCNSNSLNPGIAHMRDHPAHEIPFVIRFNILNINILSKSEIGQ